MVAPAAFATPISASAVEISPGPQVTRNRSPWPTGGVVMSPSTATARPMWYSRMAKPMICSFSRPPPNTTIRRASAIIATARSTAASSSRSKTCPSSARAVP